MQPPNSDSRRETQADTPRSFPLPFDLFLASVVDYGIFSVGLDGGITDWNPGAERMFGYTQEEILGQHYRIVFTPEDVAAGVPEQEIHIAREKGRADDTRWHLRQDGSRFWVEGANHAVRDENGNLLGFVKVCRDMTERRQAEEALRASHQHLEEVLESITDAFYALDKDFRFTYVNHRCEKLWGTRREDVVGKRLSATFPQADGSESYQQHLRVAAERQPVRYETVSPILGRWMECSIHPTTDGGLSTYFRDIFERKQHEDALRAANEQLVESNVRLEALSVTDGLTGLKNHRAFQDQLKTEVERAIRYKAPLSVLIMDVDHFKAYNDTYGHPAGDVVLRKIAEVVEAAARHTDFVARIGGEEFGAVLPAADAENARVTAERLRAAIEAVPWENQPVTASFGVATLSATTTDATGLVTGADAALYRSKWRGRNRVTHIADPLDLAEVVEETRLQPYADMVRHMLDMQEDTLDAATETIKESLRQSYDMTVRSWSRILGLKGRETDGHSERVTEMTVRLARAAGMSEEEVLYMKWGALLHDIGKIGLPHNVLQKPGELNDEEWATMRRHPDLGYELLAPTAFLGPALDILRFHHEKWDGSGYPSGLKGEAIPWSARLVSVVDVYDALCSDRPYRRAWPEDQAREYLRLHAGTHFDPRAVELFLNTLD